MEIWLKVPKKFLSFRIYKARDSLILIPADFYICYCLWNTYKLNIKFGSVAKFENQTRPF